MAKERFKSADEVSAEYMELQLSRSKESRFENWLVTILTLGFIFSFAILFWVLPDKEKSVDENRVLATFPEFTLDGFLHGGFTEEVGTYMADQFPCRNFFVGLKGVSEAVQLKGQNNDIIIGKDDYLIARFDYPDEETLNTNISSAARFIKIAEANGINCTTAFAGRKMDVAKEKLPALYGSYYSDRIFSILDKECKAGGIEYLNLRDTLSKIEAEGEELYYMTDHHWRSLGAYYAYCEIVKSMGITPYEISDFDIEVASEEFFGTTWSSAGVKWTDSDSIEYFRWEGDESLTLRIENPAYKYEDCEYVKENGKTYATFKGPYVREMLEGKDKYASFLGGNNNSYVEVTMEADGKERETIVLLRDSFSDSLAPFLARHFDLILLDLRTSAPDTIGLCLEKGIDDILLIYNMESLTTSADLAKLNKGLANHKK